MAIVNFGHEIGDGQLQLVYPEMPGIAFGRELVTLPEEQKNIRRQPDYELGGGYGPQNWCGQYEKNT